MSIVTTVTETVKESVGETEAKVAEVVRDLQGTVVEYVQKGIDYVQSGTFAEHVQKGGDFATERLSKVNYPEKLPAPSEVVDAVSGFVTSAVESATEAIAPLVRKQATDAPSTDAPATDAPVTDAPAAKAAKATKSTKSTKAAKATKAPKSA